MISVQVSTSSYMKQGERNSRDDSCLFFLLRSGWKVHVLRTSTQLLDLILGVMCNYHRLFFLSEMKKGAAVHSSGRRELIFGAAAQLLLG